MTSEEEKKNKRVGMIISLGTHALVVLLFAFLMAWREPNPPLPEYGIELNFGLDDAGTGTVQPLTPPVDSESEEEAAPEEESTEIQEDEDIPSEATEELIEEIVTQPEVTDDLESPDVVVEQEEVVEKIENVQEEVENEQIEPAEKPKEDKPENDTEVKGGLGVDGDAKEAEAVSQGDKTNETGDQGDEDGKLDERALYGVPGGGGGSNLELAGWMWDFKPLPDDTSDESGRIVFEITIDNQGEIISIKTIERTVSPSVEQIYKVEVEKLTFSKTDNLPPAPQSKGRITFIIKSN